MKGKDLFDVINDIDEKHISEIYEEPVRPEIYRIEKRSGGWIKPAIASAACLAVVAGAAGAATLGGGGRDSTIPNSGVVYDGSYGAASGGMSADGNGTELLGQTDGEVSETEPVYVTLAGFGEIPEEYDYLVNYVGKHYEDIIYEREIYYPRSSAWEKLDKTRAGIDFNYEIGGDIYALGSGEVVYAGAADKGNAVIIRHTDGSYALYGYLDGLSVSVGDTVDEGQVIATVGGEGSLESANFDCVMTVWHTENEVTVQDWNKYTAHRETLVVKDGISSGSIIGNSVTVDYYEEMLERHYSKTSSAKPTAEPGVVTGKYKGFENIEKYYNDFYLRSDETYFVHWGRTSHDWWNDKLMAPEDDIDYSVYLGFEFENDGQFVYAMDGGEVVYTGESDCGGLIIIKHADDDYSLYGFVDTDKMLVKAGDIVAMGQQIAFDGDMNLWHHINASYADDRWNGVTGKGGDRYREIWRFKGEPTLDMWNAYIVELKEDDFLYRGYRSKYIMPSLNGDYKTVDDMIEYYREAGLPYVNAKGGGHRTVGVMTGIAEHYGLEKSFSENCVQLDLEFDRGDYVFAVVSGTVVYAGESKFGNTVIIKTADDDYTLYGYLDEIEVTEGQMYAQGAPIGCAGSSQDYNKTDLEFDDITILRLDREITVDEWDAYATAFLNAPIWGWDDMVRKGLSSYVRGNFNING